MYPSACSLAGEASFAVGKVVDGLAVDLQITKHKPAAYLQNIARIIVYNIHHPVSINRFNQLQLRTLGHMKG